MLHRQNRLTSRYEFNKVNFFSKKNNQRISTEFFYLNYIQPPGYEGVPKFGIVVSNNVSKKAKDRNRLKRIYREIIRRNLQNIKSDLWIVVFPKVKSLTTNHEELNSTFNKVLQKLHVSR